MRIEEILKKHNLKSTGCRKFILNELLNCGAALSENEIKQKLPDLFDRVTFYRSLKILEECTIIHRIVLPDSSVKYALNYTFSSHAHFHCVECGSVICMDTDIVNLSSLPNGFTLNSMNVLLEGICPKCNKI